MDTGNNCFIEVIFDVLTMADDAFSPILLQNDLSISPQLDLAKAIVAAITNSVLAVSDADGFLEQGGSIHFRHLRNRLRFSVNNEEALSYGMRLSSKLIRFAVSRSMPQSESRR